MSVGRGGISGASRASGLPPGDKLKDVPGHPEIPFLLKPYAAETLLNHLKSLLSAASN